MGRLGRRFPKPLPFRKKSSKVFFSYLELLKMPFNGLVVLIKTLRTFDNH